MKTLTINYQNRSLSDSFSDNYQDGSYKLLTGGPWGILHLGYKLADNSKTGMDILSLLEKLAADNQVSLSSKSNVIPNEILLLVNERATYEKMESVIRNIYMHLSNKSSSSSSNSSC